MQAEGHQQRMHYEQEQGYEDEQAGVDEPLPDFGQVDGTTIKLSGLDYSMIKAETAKERKKDLLANIKNKIGQFAHRMPVNVTLPRSNKTSQNDQLTKNIELIAKTKPTINTSTFYLFPTNPNFSPLFPQTITRRFGKMHTFPLFIQHESKDIDEFKHLIVQDDRIKEHRKQKHLEASKIVPELASDGDDSDDIFGKDSEEGDEAKGPKIKIGNKLSLGVNQQEIFGKKSYNEAVKEQKQVQVVKKDKYDFLRKKVKPNEDAYEQCFPDADL